MIKIRQNVFNAGQIVWDVTAATYRMEVLFKMEGNESVRDLGSEIASEIKIIGPRSLQVAINYVFFVFVNCGQPGLILLNCSKELC